VIGIVSELLATYGNPEDPRVQLALTALDAVNENPKLVQAIELLKE
jgi:hypothetical protein